MTSNSTPVRRIAVCGGGLAGQMTVAMLSRHLPQTTEIVFVETDAAPRSDAFYGSVAAASAYAFNLAAGLSEPRLLKQSDTAFSWGTRYVSWGAPSRSWLQCFHLPLPIIDGVLFQHYLTRQGIRSLEPYLVPARAAERGAFVHPMQGKHRLLSRAEYGYQFDPPHYAALFSAGIDRTHVRTVSAQIAHVERSGDDIKALSLSNGETISADLYVDCTGPAAALLGGATRSGRRVYIAHSRVDANGVGAPYRSVHAEPFGWRSETPLQGRVIRATLYAAEDERAALAVHGAAPVETSDAIIGRQPHVWRGNCVAIGQAAATLEPLTPAPLMLLQRDIERLAALIPLSHDMGVERREFNRQFDDDHTHATLFTRALIETDGLPVSAYWNAVRAEPLHDKLARKITQFESRGLLVSYDLEPFDPEDWTILHYGMGRTPRRHDRMADAADAARVAKYLDDMAREITAMTAQMPSHHDYVSALKRYLAQKNG